MKTKLATAVIALGLSAPAMAAFTVTFSEVGGDVVATGTGSLITAPYTLTNSPVTPQINASLGNIALASSMVSYFAEGSVTGPSNFGPGTTNHATSSSGDSVAFVANLKRIAVPLAYVSGSALNSSATWSGATFASLGLTPGTYEWTWGSGPTADKFTVQVGPKAVSTHSIPTLSEWGLIGMSSLLAMLGFSTMRRRKIQSS